jgi:hypothetical protein
VHGGRLCSHVQRCRKWLRGFLRVFVTTCTPAVCAGIGGCLQLQGVAPDWVDGPSAHMTVFHALGYMLGFFYWACGMWGSCRVSCTAKKF